MEEEHCSGDDFESVITCHDVLTINLRDHTSHNTNRVHYAVESQS
jgi:hypothetical protein